LVMVVGNVGLSSVGGSLVVVQVLRGTHNPIEWSTQVERVVERFKATH
jgi:hypothetical protein